MINPAELLFSVDEQNHPIEPQPRALSHETGIWHRSCHVWVINDRGQILCQQRSLLKDRNPGRWEPFFGGHLAPNQSYSISAITEVQEELGLDISEQDLEFFQEYRYIPGTEYQGVFLIHWNGDADQLKLEEEEVQMVEWRRAEEVKRLVVDEKSEKWAFFGYEEELLESLK